MLSISSLFYIIVGQFLFSRVLKLAPISGYAPGLDAVKFLVLPIALSLLARLGGEARLYRAMFLEEIGKDYVRTARAKGLAEHIVMGRHVLRNALIPIITSAGSYLPYVFLGSLVFESFFGLPGLGAYVIEAIGKQDFAVVRRWSSSARCSTSPPTADRRGLHLGRSARAAGLIANDTDDAEVRSAVDRRRDLAADRRAGGLCGHVARSPQLSTNWRKVFRNAPALASSLVLLLCLGVTLLDSVHYRARLPPSAAAPDAAVAYDTRTRSLLDAALADLIAARESTYSRPLAYVGFTKESLVVGGDVVRVAPRLQFGGRHLSDTTGWAADIARRALFGLGFGALAALAASTLLVAWLARSGRRTLRQQWSAIRHRDTPIPCAPQSARSGCWRWSSARPPRCRALPPVSAPTSPATTCCCSR